MLGFIRVCVYKKEPTQSGEHFDYKNIAFYQFKKNMCVFCNKYQFWRCQKTHQCIETIKNKTFMKKEKHTQAET